MKASKTASRRSSILQWAIELVVVFVGVYAAFLLSEFKARKETEEQRHQIVEAVRTEIEEIMFRADRAAGGLAQMVAYYDSTIAAGEKPPLRPMIEPVRAESHMWEATLQMGGLDIVDVPTMYRISKFYNVLNAGFEQLDQMRELSETLIIPNLDEGSDEFYDPVTGKLRHKYQWYLDGLRNIASLSLEVKSVGNELLNDLEAGEK